MLAIYRPAGQLIPYQINNGCDNSMGEGTNKIWVYTINWAALLNYVDDWLAAGRTKNECYDLWNALCSLLKDLGLRVAAGPDKLISPRQLIKFLGLWINSMFMKNGKLTVAIRMDQSKLAALRKDIKSLIRQNKQSPGSIKRSQLDSLAGSMVHLSQTAYGARGYYLQINKLKNSPSFNGKLDRGFMIESYFWQKEIDLYDGTGIIVDSSQLSSKYWATDAFRYPRNGPVHTAGIGGFYDGKITSIWGSPIELRAKMLEEANQIQISDHKLFPVDPKLKHTHFIQYLELFAVYWDLTKYLSELESKHIPIRVDNSNAKSWLWKGGAPVPYLPLIRRVCQICMRHNITLYPVWVSSQGNTLADLASKGKLEELKALIPKWTRQVAMKEKYTGVSHTTPGPVYLYGRGYYDDREVDAEWGEDHLVVQSISHDSHIDDGG